MIRLFAMVPSIPQMARGYARLSHGRPIGLWRIKDDLTGSEVGDAKCSFG
jgi:hypothetical protein